MEQYQTKHLLPVNLQSFVNKNFKTFGIFAFAGKHFTAGVLHSVDHL